MADENTPIHQFKRRFGDCFDRATEQPVDAFWVRIAECLQQAFPIGRFDCYSPPFTAV